MPSFPSLQSLVGANSGTDNCGVDFTRKLCWQLSSTHLSKYDLILGTEIAAATLASLQASNDNIGLLYGGNVMLTGGSGLYNGGVVRVDGQGLTLDYGMLYPAPNFGSGQMTCIEYYNIYYLLDRCIGNAVIPVLNRTQCSQQSGGAGIYTDTVNWPAAPGAQMCADIIRTGKAWMMNSNVSFNPQEIILTHFTFTITSLQSATIISTLTAANIDATWTQITVEGICMDLTDQNVMAVVSGDGTVKSYLIKIDRVSGALIWTAAIPLNFSGNLPVGNAFQFSDIRNSRIALFTNTPNTVTIYDTTDGSVVNTYTLGLAGISQLGHQGGQCYSDTLSGIVLNMGFNQVAGSPTLLNSTPTSFSGWSVLYVAAPVVQVARRYLNEHRPVRVIP